MDQTASHARFADRDVLVLHMVVGEPVIAPNPLHASPSRIGEMAEAIAPKILVLSHLTGWSLADFETNVALVRSRYDGEIVIAEDLLCVPLP